MNPTDIDRVFGRGRLRMLTGAHVEVFRESAEPGERRRYTKRFLATPNGDFRSWTEREWRILARLIGHGVAPVPDVVQFDRGSAGRPALVQTYDAGITVDHWVTLLPVERDGVALRHVFEDCAHWWALARHCLIALDAIHELRLVHLDLKADNVCIPFGPDDFDPRQGGRLFLRFDRIALIDFAFSLVSGENLTRALPIARQLDHAYQSPRLLQALDAGSGGDLAPTRALDWRCDLFSLAAMLRRHLPAVEAEPFSGWNATRLSDARALLERLIDVHDADAPSARPHAALIALASRPLDDADLQASLARGWQLGDAAAHEPVAPLTPITRIAPALPVVTAPVAAGAWAHAPVTATTSVLAPMAVPASGPIPGPTIRLPDGHASDPALPATSAPALEAVPATAQPTAPATSSATVTATATAPGITTATAPDAALATAPRPANATAPAAATATASAPALERAHSEPIAVDPVEAEARTREHARRATEHARARSRAWQIAAAVAVALPLAGAAWWARERVDPGPVTVGLDAGTRVAAAPGGPATAVLPRGPAAGADGIGTRSKGGTPEAARAEAPAATATRPASPTGARATAEGSTTATATPPKAARAATAPDTRVIAAAPVAGERPVPSATSALRSGDSRDRAAADAQPVRGSVGSVGSVGSAEPTETRRTRAGRTPQQAAAEPARADPPARPAVRNEPAPVGVGAQIPRPEALRATQAIAAAAGRAAVAGGIAPPAGPARGDAAGTSLAASLPRALPDASPAAAAAPRPRGEPGVGVPPPAPAEASLGDARDHGARARELLDRQIPRVAQRAERAVLRVLFVAAQAEDASDDDAIRAAARALPRAHDLGADIAPMPREARALNEAARTALWRQGNLQAALRLQLRAFGANPVDAEVVGNTAYLLLRQPGADVEAARQLALHALTLRDPRFPAGRLEDWNTLAIASALAGNERDARNAWFVTLALAPSLERHCRAALNARSVYGDRLRASIEAMLERAQASGRSRGAPACDSPPPWVASSQGR